MTHWSDVSIFSMRHLSAGEQRRKRTGSTFRSLHDQFACLVVRTRLDRLNWRRTDQRDRIAGVKRQAPFKRWLWCLMSLRPTQESCWRIWRGGIHCPSEFLVAEMRISWTHFLRAQVRRMLHNCRVVKVLFEKICRQTSRNSESNRNHLHTGV